MSLRASKFGSGGVGGQVEYPGDLTPPTRSYAASAPSTPLMSRLFNPPSINRTRSAVVNRQERRGGMQYFYSHGAIPMPVPAATRATGPGQVPSSAFQRMNNALVMWDINPAWGEAGYPQNQGWSTRVPQLETNITGGPGTSQQTARPEYTRVQAVPRSRVTVRTYPTRGQ